MNSATKKMVYSAVLAAMAVILIYAVPHFSIVPSVPFLEYDMGDVPLFFGAVALGPYYGLGITAVACIIQGLTISAESGFIGILMHFIATGAFVLCAGFMTRKGKSLKAIIPAFICGAITQVLVMVPLNLIISPVFLGGKIGEVFKATLKAFVTFPHDSSAVVCGMSFASAFIIAFTVSLFYTVTKTEENGIAKYHMGIKPILIGVVSGFIYGSMVLLIMNLIFSNITFYDGSQDMIRKLMFTGFIPFNMIKAVGNAVIAYVLYALVGRRVKL